MRLHTKFQTTRTIISSRIVSVVGGGGGWWWVVVVEADFSVKLKPQLNNKGPRGPKFGM